MTAEEYQRIDNTSTEFARTTKGISGVCVRTLQPHGQREAERRKSEEALAQLPLQSFSGTPVSFLLCE